MSLRPQAQVAADLHQWLTEEMHFRPKGVHVKAKLPTADDLNSVCRGTMLEMWTYVLKHVRSVQTVRKVKQNLALRQAVASSSGERTSGEDVGQTRRRRATLAAQLAGPSITAVAQVEREIDRLHAEISSTDGSYREACARVHDLQRRATLLRLYGRRLLAERQRHDEYARRLTARTDRLRQLASKTGGESVYYTAVESAVVNGNQLETACMKGVRECSEQTARFLQKMLQGELAGDRSLLEGKRAEVWQRLECLLSSHSPTQFLRSMSLHVHHCVADLRERTANVDLDKDALRLRCEYESGQLAGGKDQPEVLQSVRHLVEESQVAHVRRFLEAQRHRSNTRRGEARLAEGRREVDVRLRARYHDNPGCVQLAGDLFSAEVQTAMARASVRALQVITAQTKEHICQATREQQLLFEQYQQIQNFKKLTNDKQMLIRVLVKQNMASQAKLNAQRREVNAYRTKAVGSHRSDTAAITAQLTDRVTGELSDFMKLSLPMFQLTTIDGVYRIAVQDLSIHRLRAAEADTTAGRFMQQMLTSLEFPSYRAAEFLLTAVLSQQDAVTDTQHRLADCGTPSSHADHKATLQHVTALCERMRCHDAAQLARLAPLLQQKVGDAARALADCARVTDTAQQWWDQPGQHSAPWLRVDDQTLRQWTDRWTVVVTQLRQLHH